MIDFYFGITPVYKFGLNVFVPNILESVQKAQETSETSLYSSFLGLQNVFFFLP